MYSNQNRFGGMSQASAAALDEGLRQHMLRVYNYMGLGLVVTGLVAFIVGTTPALYVPIFSTPLRSRMRGSGNASISRWVEAAREMVMDPTQRYTFASGPTSAAVD